MPQEVNEQRTGLAQVSAVLIWLGGGHRRELGERHERSAHAVAGAVALSGAVLAWLVATLAVGGSARWPLTVVAPLTLVFGLLVGAVTRGTIPGPDRSRLGVVARAAVAAAVGVVVGDLVALVLLSSSIDHRLDERALRHAESTPAVGQASAALQQTRDARAALDGAVAQARDRQDKALIVARCEYRPTPGCPETRITGVPGAGPETRTANELLADAQHELDTALAARDTRAPELDATISRQEQALRDARNGAVVDADRGLGARWVAMNDLTSADAGAMALRLLMIGVCVLLYLAPLILGLWRGETTHDRRATSRAERERAELDADTAIAVKRAEVRREAEILWAEHQLTQARLAVEAQTEIDREHQRRRVSEALDTAVHAPSRRAFEPGDDDVYLPIAAAAEAASRALTQLPAPEPAAGLGAPETPDVPENLPAPLSPGGQVEPHQERNAPLIPSIPDATKAAARWIRPLVPPFVARVIDTTTQPLRTARQVFEGVLEETEEITFTLKRSRKVTVNSEASDTQLSGQPASAETPSVQTDFATSSRHEPGKRARRQVAGADSRPSLPRRTGHDADRLPVQSAESDRRRALTKRDGPPELGPPDGPRQLPPPK
ncbi:DUF4407 domain-containing protein [Mycobacterium sp. 852002-40037_SCH5390672]|uniref:DUF4407 domain-containing protein n=1 Tax=Mycobacterium sp. 852002-40037_SCH5390672 TaxID=1834089 RepID=UPI0008060278|nr:DUF4407 domain-containing protein [Mycobacterium sp. 852002-40037_SCH5390672]OBB90135.1 hypothetical protein A5782_16895 [Mycobacterium sp. 852002-40037_SCH5390672]